MLARWCRCGVAGYRGLQEKLELGMAVLVHQGTGGEVSTIIDARAGVAKLVVVIAGALQVMTLGLVVDVIVDAEAEGGDASLRQRWR